MNKGAIASSSILRVFIKSQKVTILSSDLNWGGNNCAQPMGTGISNRSGKASGTIPHDQLIVLDAVTRAVDHTGIDYQIVDIGQWGFLKRLRTARSLTVPRIEYNGKVLEGTPTTNEIVQFISEHL